MAWFLLALLGPLLYAITNYLDKLVLERYLGGGGIATILMFSGLFSVFSLPFLYAADPTVFALSRLHIAALGAVGILNFFVLLFYLKAIRDAEVSTAIIFYQLVPVVALGLGYVILGETLTARQLIAMGLIVLGTSVVSFEADDARGFRLRTRTVFYMLLASFCWALGAVLFKAVALEERVVRSLFWENLMLAVIGAGLMACGGYRRQFLKVLRSNTRAVLTLNAVNESAYIAANVAMAFAYLLAPVSLVLLANSYQALFAMLIGACLTRFWPRLIVERIRPSQVLQKAVAIALTALGTYEMLAVGH